MSIRVFNAPSLAGEACVQEISSALRFTPGIVYVRVDVENKQISIDFDSALINEAQVMQLIRKAGYEVE